MNKIAIVFLFLFFSEIISAQIPSSFDLRNVNGENYVSSVKNQQGGNSWTYAVCASAESNLLMNGNWSTAGENGEPDLAEYHMDWWNGFNSFNNDDAGGTNTGGFPEHSGGNFSMAAAYLSRGEGFVRNIDGQSYDTPPERYNSGFHYWYVDEIENFTIDSNLNGIDSIKSKLMQNGAAAAAICYDASFIDVDFNHFQPASSNLAANHAVAIIGWDDNHTVPAASADGAWLAKNCWGTSWGNGGYFWISYYDKYACKTYDTGAHFYAGADTLPYNIIYYHDYHGKQDVMTSADSVFNAFHAKENVRIKAASFFTETDNVTYTIKVYGRYADGELSDLKLINSGTLLHKGFHTINLLGDVPLNNGDDFFVLFYLSDKKYAYDRTSNITLTYGGKNAKNVIESAAMPGESFYAQSGQWSDFYNYSDPSGFNNTGNFCLKILADYNQNLGINTDKSNLNIFPNPTNNFIFINSKEIGFYTIYDLQGKSVLQGKLNVENKIDISVLKKGIYFLKINFPDRNVVKKVIKR